MAETSDAEGQAGVGALGLLPGQVMLPHPEGRCEDLRQ